MVALQTTFTRYYQLWRAGDLDAQEKLIKLVYNELCRMARFYLVQESYAPSIDPRMLADDVATLLLGAPDIDWNNRKDFFRTAADRMQKLLVDHARHRDAQKRIPYNSLLPLHEFGDIFSDNKPDLMAVNDALEAFQKIDLRAYQVVKLRFFFGLKEKEVAQVLEISIGAVKNDWKMAKLWLRTQLSKGRGH